MSEPESAAATRAEAPAQPALLRQVRLAALAVGLAAGLYHLRYHAAYTLDDAYISFRYARNLARGAGLTFNPGEHVKGYSNTLYTLLMSLPELFGRDPITLSKALGYASFAGIALYGARAWAAADTPALRDRALWFVLLCAASTSLAVHCMNGLETGLYAALLFAGVLRRVREQDAALAPWSALLLSAAVLSRPEGILLYAACALHDLVWRSWRRRFGRQDLVFYLAPPLVYTAELWLSARYYGLALPNTYYAKTGPGGAAALVHGALAQLQPGSYLALGMLGTGLGIPGFLLALPALFARRYRRRSWALSMQIGAQLVFIARAGDDWAPAFRFGVPCLPALFMLLADSIGALAALARRNQRLTGCALALGLLLLIVPRQLADSRTIDKERFVNADNKLVQGAYFASLAEPGITLSSFDIGGQGYAAGGFDILDTAGLTTRETVGCRRGGPRCARYAELVMPELVRLHNNRARDAFVSKTVVRHAAYVPLDGGKYLLQRGLLFLPALPGWVRPAEARELAGVQLAAADAPQAVRAGAATRVTLYLLRREAEFGPALAGRRLHWQGPAGKLDAGATGSALGHLNAASEWHAGELFADLVSLRAPDKVGAYTLVLDVAEQSLPVAQVEVLGAPDAEARAQTLAAQAVREPEPETRLRGLSRASELGDVPYQRAVVDEAHALAAQANVQRASDPLSALRTLQRARHWLVRAYWESGRAGASLRHELTVNAALRGRLIALLLDN